MSKPKLYMTKGLPASGKSTWAKEMLLRDTNLVRVNKDDLRSMLHASKHSKGNEKQVLKIRDQIISESLLNKRSVIVDDTNFNPDHEHRLRQIAEEFGADFIIKDFTDVPIDVCIARDATRSNSVGKSVILRMYRQYLRRKNEKPLKPVVYGDKLPYCVIFDLDGTLAHIHDRSPYDGKACGSDLTNDSIVVLLSLLHAGYEKINDIARSGGWQPGDFKTIILSGRNGDSRTETEAWLSKNNIGYDELHMRKEGDARQDSVIKKELFDEHIKDKYNVMFIVDDRDQVVDLWRSMGITCLQCNYGDF
jgi:predicted kinase